MATEDPDEKFAEYQKVGDQYEPDLPGPLIGERTSTHELVHEFAKGDPNFARKTAALPSTYPSYRVSKGDGNCGWRAIGFAYFELLLAHGSSTLVASETARLAAATREIQALPNFEPALVDDFVEPTFTLLGNLPEWFGLQGQGDELLRSAFNDGSAGQYMTFHLRLLAASHITHHPASYLPYLPDAGGSAEPYVQTLLTANEQLDEVALQALYEALLRPAGIALEVLNLNRSENEAVDVVVRREDGVEGMTVRLLYRPGHYDVIYKGELEL